MSEIRDETFRLRYAKWLEDGRALRDLCRSDFRKLPSDLAKLYGGGMVGFAEAENHLAPAPDAFERDVEPTPDEIAKQFDPVYGPAPGPQAGEARQGHNVKDGRCVLCGEYVQQLVPGQCIARAALREPTVVIPPLMERAELVDAAFEHGNADPPAAPGEAKP